MAAGVRIGEAFIEVTADANNAFRGIERQAGAAGSKSGGILSGAFGKSVAQVGTVIAGAFAVDKITGFFGTAVSGASDLNEETSKSQVIFGSASSGIADFASTAAQNLGLTETQALQTTGTFGNMFTQMGFGQTEASKLSQGVTTLSADLGSFNNLPTADVADMMSAAFRGEYDSIQALLPGINAASVEQKALAMTGKESAAALTDQEKAMAVLALANEQGAAAQGDFARTSGGFAGQQKIATATLGEMATKIGTMLLPAMTGLMSFVNTDLLPGIQNIGTFITGTVMPALTSFGNWFVTNLPTITNIGIVIGTILLPSFIRLGIQAAISAAQMVASWVIAGAGAIAAGVTYVIQSAIVVASWVLMGVQSMLAAAKMAAAWLIAMGPIGLVIAAVVGLVAIIIANWDTIKATTIAVFNAVVNFLRDAWNNIVNFVTTGVNKVRDFITTGFNAAKSIAVSVFNTIVNTISSAFNNAVNFVSNGINNIRNFFSNGFNALRGIADSAWNNVKSAVSNGVSGAVDLVRSLPDKAKSALGNLGSTLMGSGAALIQGFKDGIMNAFGSVKNVVSGGLQSIRDLFPFSPAKEGPFSGRGYTSFSGKALATDFAKGIASQQSKVQAATDSLMGMASGALSSDITALSGKVRVESDLSNVKTKSARATTAESHGIIVREVHVNIDAASVKDISDIRDLFNQIGQVARSGRGTPNARIA